MKITKMSLENFTCFESLHLDFSSNINVIIGENSIGKTHILKNLYSITKTLDDLGSELNRKHQSVTKENSNELLTDKLINVYRVEKIGRLVKRKVGRNMANLAVTIDNNKKISLSFSNLASNKVNLQKDIREIKFKNHSKPVYLPPKEIISATENFSALYDEYHIAFEETYADLCKLLLLPSKKGPNSDAQNNLLHVFEGAIDGKVILDNNIFKLKRPGDGLYEMGLVAEGYRKFATILQLVQNGVLTSKSLLFWDEPESNINPKLISTTAKIIKLLADLGVQIFISTHSYFLVKELNMLSTSNDGLVKFFSLYRENNTIKSESQSNSDDLDNNVISEEFFNLYNKEMEYFYDIDGE